jgi:hypothetical protein
MKKAMFTLALILFLVFGVFAQAPGTASGPADLILILDTSAGMGNFYHETSEYLIGPFLREYLRIGDTFHLISFAGDARLEISRRIAGLGDIETIIARMLLMYPLDPRSDLSGALAFAERYASSLPGGRFKRLVLVSDGNIPNTQSIVDGALGRLRNQGAEFQFVRMPVAGITAPVGQLAQQQGQMAPGQVAPGQQIPGQVTPGQQVPGQMDPGQQIPGQLAPDQMASGQEAPGLQMPGQVSPGQVVPGQQMPGQVTPGQRTPGQSSGTGFPLYLLIALGILALLALALLIIFASRRLQSSPNRVMARAAAPMRAREQDRLSDSYAGTRTQRSDGRGSLEHPPPRRKAPPMDRPDQIHDIMDSGPVMLNLFVEDQNTAIGRRNIHAVKKGYTFSVGGGKSDFLIFLVSVPPRIGEITFDGRNCTFYPRQPKYFPDIGSQSVHNCIGKSIRIVSDRGYELFIRVERYQDPLQVLNKLLNSISVPGPVINPV